MSSENINTKYVYKRIRIKTLLEEATLNKMGEKGWRMVSIIKDKEADSIYTYYFVKEEIQVLYLNDGEVFEIEDE